MKKKLLFIMPSLDCGGAEKALTTFLSLTDFDRFEVDLFLFRRQGFFLDMVPEQVRIIDAGDDYRLFDGSLINGTLGYLCKGKINLAVTRWRYAFIIRSKDSSKKQEKVWRLLSKVLPVIEQKYDAAIGYLEGTATYFCAYCVTSTRKIAFFHTDYEKCELNPEFDQVAYSKIDKVVAVSTSCKDSLIKKIPSLATKTVVIGNILRKESIERLAAVPLSIETQEDEMILLTIARLSPEKGIDTAVKTCAILVERGVRLKWYILGDGPQRNDLEILIKKNGIENIFILAGKIKNPYNYLARCDIYVQPSRYEGQCIALEEAKLLAKPFVATKFSPVCEKTTDGVNGLLAEHDSASIAEAIHRLIDDNELRSMIASNLVKSAVGNEFEAEKFFALLD